MLDGTPELNALLKAWRDNSNSSPYVAEIFSFELASGAVIRWTSADQDIKWGTNTWVRGPGISRSQISKSVGTGASELDITLLYDDSVTMSGGVKVAAFIAGGGFFFSTLKFWRAYAPDPKSAIVGLLPKFRGRVTQLRDAGETQATLTSSDSRSLLNVQVPKAVWKPACDHTVFDAGCALNRENFKVSGHVTAGSGTLLVHTNLSVVKGYLDLGKIVFTSGTCKGQIRTVKTQLANGDVTVVRPLPSRPMGGDTFYAFAGCDLTENTCITKFNNKRHFKGQPFVPVVETGA